jgi:hypothetical protein
MPLQFRAGEFQAPHLAAAVAVSDHVPGPLSEEQGVRLEHEDAVFLARCLAVTRNSVAGGDRFVLAP